MIVEGKGVFLSCRKFQESGYIVSCLLENHGLIRGYARLSRKHGAIMPGCVTHVTWKARLGSHLGYITLENEKSISPLAIFDKLRNLALCASVTLISMVLHEGEQHPQIYKRLTHFLDSLHYKEQSYLKQYAFLEVDLLEKSGFGLDLQTCAATNLAEDLAYVSPKTGRAVSSIAGRPYHNKLFLLPAFLRYQGAEPSFSDIYNTLVITGHFFNKYIWATYHKSGEPLSRIRLKAELQSQI